MMPRTPRGTRTWRICSPFGSVQPRITSPIGSARSATSRSASAMSLMRSGVRVSRSTMPTAVPLPVARSTSLALACTMTSECLTRASAIAMSAASLAARDAVARSTAASFARRAVARTASRSSVSGVLPVMTYERSAPSEQDEVVAVHDSALVRRPERDSQLTGGPAQQGRQLDRRVVDQAPGDGGTRLGVDEVHGVPRLEVAGDFGDACGQQRQPTVDDGAY